MNNPFQPFLETSGVVILDGALATELEKRGADLKDPLWSAKILLEAPDLIRQVHYDYFVAGADVAITASYQATFEGFAQRGLGAEQVGDLLRLSTRLAMEARDQFWAEPAHRVGRLRPLVAASVGPYAALLSNGAEYSGNYGLSVEQLIDFHRPRLAILAGSGADLLACETIPCPEEGEALVRLLAEFPDTPAWLSFSCCDEAHVCQGEPLADCVAMAASSDQIMAVGVNCTPPRHIPGLLRSVAGLTAKPLLVYPNSGETWEHNTYSWRSDPDCAAGLGAPAQQWYELGARLIGGCCRTGPGDIQQISRTLKHALLR